MQKPERHIWEEGSTHRAVAGKEYDEAWDYVAALEAQLHAHIENEGDECPLCDLEARLQQAVDDGVQAATDCHAAEVQVADYELLKSAVNENSGECLPNCDSCGHEEGCEYVSMSATMIIQQKKIVALEAQVARLTELLNTAFHLRFIDDTNTREEQMEFWIDVQEALDA